MLLIATVCYLVNEFQVTCKYFIPQHSLKEQHFWTLTYLELLISFTESYRISDIKLTSQCILDASEPHLYMEKLGFSRV